MEFLWALAVIPVVVGVRLIRAACLSFAVLLALVAEVLS